MNLLKQYKAEEGVEIIAECKDPDGDEYVYTLNEKTGQVAFATKSKSAVSGFKDFVAKHPFMTGMAVSVGLNALDTYRTNKRQTVRFFATNQIEKKLYKKLADDLAATGNYMITRRGKWMKGGWMWELKRKGAI